MATPRTPEGTGAEPTAGTSLSGRADVRDAARGGATNLLTAVASLSEAVFHPVAAHLYGTASYGFYRWGVSCVEPLLRLSPLGTDFALLRYLPSHRVGGEPELERQTIQTAIWLTALGGSVFGVLTFFFSGPLASLQGKPEAGEAVTLLAPAIPISALVVMLVHATMGAKTMKYSFVVRGVTQPVLLLAAATAAGLLWPTLASLCLAHLAAAAATAFVAVWSVWRIFGRRLWGETARAGHDRRARRMLHWDMLRFSIPMGMAEFVNAVLQRTDVLLIAFYAGADTVGIYAGAEAVSRVVSNVRYAFDPVASAILSESLRLKDRVRLRDALQLMSRWTALLTIPLFVVFISIRGAILELFPSAFLPASGPLAVLLLGHLVNGCVGLTGFVLVMDGRSRLALLNNLVSAVTNVVLCLMLLPRFGMMGAAIASAGTVALLQVLQLVEVLCLYRVAPFSPGFMKAVAAGAVAWLLGQIAVPAAGTAVAVMALRGGFIVAAYGTLVLLWGVAAEDRDLFRRTVARLRGGNPL